MKAMTSFRLARIQLWNRKTRLAVQWLMVVLGFSAISGFFTLNSKVNDQLVVDLGDVSQVWTAKGSPLQGLLANVYHMDAPLGNIPLPELEPWLTNSMVERYTRIGYGDTYHGRRILGADDNWKDIYHLQLKSGGWPSTSMEVVLSESLAKELELQLGSEFEGQHGELGDEHHHEEHYVVVGIFANSETVADRLIITPIQSVWDVHHVAQNELAATAVLVKTNSPMAMFQLPKQINSKSTFQAILPSIEVNRIYALMGNTQKAFVLLSVLFLLFGTVSMSVTLYETMRSQQFDHTLLRIFGLSPIRLGWMVFLQSFLLLFSAWVVGIWLIKVLQWQLAESISMNYGVNLGGITLHKADFYTLLISIGIALLISLPVMIRIFKMTIHKNLKHA